MATPSDEVRSALLVLDVQNDFCSSGTLPVPDADRLPALLNRYIEDAIARGIPVYAARDWHPAATRHFAAYGGRWPVHCVQNTAGARFHPALRLPPETTLVSKGEDPAADGYSAFEGHTPDGTPLLQDLRRHGITHVYMGGLATDYCVRASALDALAGGLAVTVLDDALAGVDEQPGDCAHAIAEMRTRGARFASGAGSLAA
jgi:nicotinamidase/pyrazinamidase